MKKLRELTNRIKDEVCDHSVYNDTFETEVCGFDLSCNEFVYDIYRIRKCKKCGRKWRSLVRKEMSEGNTERFFDNVVKKDKERSGHAD